MTTYTAKPGEIQRDWYVVDAEGRTLTHVPAGTCTVHAEDGTSVLDQEVGTDGDTVASLELDDQAPTISLAHPSDGASYALGTTVRAEYTCADNVPAGLTCVGDVRDGGSLDTSAAGDFSFSVTATDTAGNATTRKVAYKVVAPSPTAAPALSAVGAPAPTARCPASASAWRGRPRTARSRSDTGPRSSPPRSPPWASDGSRSRAVRCVPARAPSRWPSSAPTART
jgi:hypothetical protein